MKGRNMKPCTIAIVLGLMLSIPMVCSLASAQPYTTVMVNGHLPGMIGDMPDTVLLEAKAKMDGNSFVSGSGSVHGITCGATFFFEFTDLTIGDNNLVMTGTIVATNMATRFGIHNFYGMWIGSEVQVTSNLDGSNMHFMLPIYGIDFSGSGRVLI